MSETSRKVDRSWDPVPDVRKGSSDDIVAIRAADEQRVREAFVTMLEGRLLQERVKECYRREGVNHYVNCREIVDQYMASHARRGRRATPEELEERARAVMKDTERAELAKRSE